VRFLNRNKIRLYTTSGKRSDQEKYLIQNSKALKPREENQMAALPKIPQKVNTIHIIYSEGAHRKKLAGLVDYQIAEH